MADEETPQEGNENAEKQQDGSPEGTSSDAGAASQGSESLREASPAASSSEPAGAESASHGGHEDHDHGLAHTAPVQLLLGVFAALTILTILTVGVTAVDLGSQGNFIVAMVIASIKAVLVMAFFMHMLWDSKFNVVVFVSSFLFVVLFLTLSLTDRSEYQRSIDAWETARDAQDAG